MSQGNSTLIGLEPPRQKPPIIGQHRAADVSPLHNILRVLVRRHNWVLGTILLCVLLALLLVVIVKPVYDATATIELNKGSAGSLDMGLGDLMSQQLTQGMDSVVLDLQTETTILESDSLALDVVGRLGLASQPPFALSPSEMKTLKSNPGLRIEDSPVLRTRLLRIFRKGLIVTPIHGTRLIRVTYESRSPFQAAQIANAIIDSYKSQYLQSHYEATSETSQWLTQQLSGLKSNVEDSEKRLTDFEKEYGILSLDMSTPSASGNESGGGGGVHSVVFQKLDTLNAEVTQAEEDRIEKEAIYHLVQTGDQDVIIGLENDPLATASKSAVLTQGNGLLALQQLREQRSQQQIALSDTSANFGPNNRHVKEITDRIRALDEQIRAELQEIVRRAQADYQLAQQTESQLRGQFDQQQTEAGKLNEKAVQLAVLSQEAFSRKRLYEDLYTKLQEANVSAGIKATNITVVDPARAQSVPIRPKPVAYLELGLLSGIFIGIIMAFGVDRIDNTLVNPLEIEEITQLPVLGVVPKFVEESKVRRSKGSADHEISAETDSRAASSLWIINHPRSVGAEALRALRTGIILSRAGGGPRLILVTSCGPGEGKSTLSANLAIAFAQHGKKVILVEADMRRPALGKITEMTDISSVAGLSSVLVGSTSFEESVLRGVHVSNLDILPSGPRPPLPAELLASVAFDDLIEELRSRYDVILVDSPPALMLTDAVTIGSKADAIIWVARAGFVTRPLIARAAQVIDRNGLPVIGFVLNLIERNQDPYGYGYGYDYGYQYSKKYGAYYGEEDHR